MKIVVLFTLSAFRLFKIYRRQPSSISEVVRFSVNHREAIVAKLVLSLTRLSFPFVRFRHNLYCRAKRIFHFWGIFCLGRQTVFDRNTFSPKQVIQDFSCPLSGSGSINRAVSHWLLCYAFAFENSKNGFSLQWRASWCQLSTFMLLNPAQEMSVGLRVVRGPDWDLADMDGGEGFVGTVVDVGSKTSSLPEKLVWVQWDTGARRDHRAGYHGAYDLRVLDNAAAGKF